ncbi:hypothetical protein [Chitinophaga qingshengii]|uniref:Class I lanthipeptide n=1 Tax=Chitinophaga qingshengii TaxID=1569794 RepID=A0ABR7TGA3_9BACT|nr:hypothetical protein [Chitinophaga qingshengii]MBC9929451.1 hypothetical protein [Chitinophaga qingshengii]
MKKQTEKKLSLGKIRVSDLSKNIQTAGAENLAGSRKCVSTGAPICSVDSCVY